MTHLNKVFGKGMENIEDQMAGVSEKLIPFLFPEILEIELEFLSVENSDTQLKKYLNRFPKRDTEVRDVFKEFFDSNAVAMKTLGPSGDNSASQSLPNDFLANMVISDRYSLERKIGEGGMGEVWIAQQSHPIARKVAIKLIKTGMDSTAVISRFELERQSLARMDHPNIAKVFDAGVTTDGLPFFAMEWVDGLPLDKYCDQYMLPPEKRLELFVPICQAVQHAHQKGIVHRDLKPGNILISSIDGRPVPKVIDFGVAKATGDNLPESSIVTQLGTIVGTLAYMSPEQAGMTDLGIDTRSDIYSLGVVLYELMTGLRPIDTQRLNEAGLAEMVRVIQEEAPSRPSAKLSSHESLPSLASVRNIEPKKLTSMLRGELDWIIMRCLEKDRDRRYESSSALAKDVQRYLANEPIEARPPSSGYLFMKFLKRNRRTVAAGTAIVAALVAGIIGTSIGFFKAEQARRDAVEAQHAESERAEGERIAKLEAKEQAAVAMIAAEKEKLANTRAQKRLSQIEKSNEILSDIFKSLNPTVIAESDEPLQVILVEKVVAAAKQLDGDAVGDSVTVAKMQSDLGLSLLALNAPEKARTVCKRHTMLFVQRWVTTIPDSLTSLFNLAESHLSCGNVSVATPMYEQANAGLAERTDIEKSVIAMVQSGMANAYVSAGEISKAIPILESSVELFREDLGESNPKTQLQIGILAKVHQDAGKPFRALRLLKKSLKVLEISNGPEHPFTLTVKANLAGVYRSVGNIKTAIPMFQQVLKAGEKTLGGTHKLTLRVMGSLATIHKESGKLDIAMPLLKERYQRTLKILGPDHPETLSGLSDLASGYLADHQYELALEYYREVYRGIKLIRGTEHPNTILSLNNVAKAQQAKGDIKLARPLFEDALAGMKKHLPTNHPSTLICMGNLATIYEDLGEIELALNLYEDTLSLQRESLGENHPDTLRTINNLAVGYWTNKQFDKSVPLFRKLVDQAAAMFGREHPNTQMTILNLGVNLKDSGQVKDAVPLLKEAYSAGSSFPGLLTMAGPQLLDAFAKLKRKEDATDLAERFVKSSRVHFGKDNLKFAFVLSNAGSILTEVEAFSESGELLSEALTIYEENKHESWKKFYALSLKGVNLMRQNRMNDCETNLLNGYQGMKRLSASIPSANRRFLLNALNSLIEYYRIVDNAEMTKRFESEIQKPGEDAK